MVFGLCCQRERLCKSLYAVQVFILAGVVYYYFQGSMQKTQPDLEIAGEPSQPIGETLRPVWGLMDKCYPVTIQQRNTEYEKKQTSEAMTHRAPRGLNDAACKKKADAVPQEDGEEKKKVGKEVAVYPSGKIADPILLQQD
ncbi:uncharacterized protein LOC119541313 [Choloepus didactylus]|uniref:uncharacterized protein LOC119541313 n=1 Tax=Choloepus didactylus TaxID=27675 RepID=UPI00189F702C|nr:uncharacterized protein LOC119541313 [Choloepus didactylus]XP_037701040.1 uncharacterized protein LOC119541313 [Choloepus didactylus]XP_037701041.1 uncharacterized protein LOC119541313 [Choloepus didactylus]XP_037701042.1 uncharacterized protein LOC119541313 [Choloepus didactylus]